MKKLIAVFAIAGFATPGLAQAPEFSSVDTDQSGGITFEEAQATMADVTEERFQAADADQSGDLSEEEFQALVSQ